jgi:hypothetical protein
VAPAAAINVIYLINARRATSLPAAEIRPCSARGDRCLDPAFDIHGRLTFLKWRNLLNRTPEWVVRWQKDRASRLFVLSHDQSGGAAARITVDRAGNAILVEGGIREQKIWRWSGGRLTLILKVSREEIVTNPLWLRHSR